MLPQWTLFSKRVVCISKHLGGHCINNCFLIQINKYSINLTVLNCFFSSSHTLTHFPWHASAAEAFTGLQSEIDFSPSIIHHFNPIFISLLSHKESWHGRSSGVLLWRAIRVMIRMSECLWAGLLFGAGLAHIGSKAWILSDLPWGKSSKKNATIKKKYLRAPPPKTFSSVLRKWGCSDVLFFSIVIFSHRPGMLRPANLPPWKGWGKLMEVCLKGLFTEHMENCFIKRWHCQDPGQGSWS